MTLHLFKYTVFALHLHTFIYTLILFICCKFYLNKKYIFLKIRWLWYRLIIVMINLRL